MVEEEHKSILTFLEKFLQLLTETNDKAASNINKGNCKESLQILEKMEKLLEVISLNRSLKIFFSMLLVAEKF